MYNFKTRLRARGYPHNLMGKTTSEVKFTERKSALQKERSAKENSAFRHCFAFFAEPFT